MLLGRPSKRHEGVFLRDVAPVNPVQQRVRRRTLSASLTPLQAVERLLQEGSQFGLSELDVLEQRLFNLLSALPGLLWPFGRTRRSNLYQFFSTFDRLWRNFGSILMGLGEMLR